MHWPLLIYKSGTSSTISHVITYWFSFTDKGSYVRDGTSSTIRHVIIYRHLFTVLCSCAACGTLTTISHVIAFRHSFSDLCSYVWDDTLCPPLDMWSHTDTHSLTSSYMLEDDTSCPPLVMWLYSDTHSLISAHIFDWTSSTIRQMITYRHSLTDLCSYAGGGTSCPQSCDNIQTLIYLPLLIC